MVKIDIPEWVVNKILKEEKGQAYNKNNTDKNIYAIQTDVNFESEVKHHSILLPYQRKNSLHLTIQGKIVLLSSVQK